MNIPTPDPSREREGRMFGESAVRLAGAAALLLGWRPDEYWNATPAELAASLGAAAGADGEPPERGAIEALMARFPD